MPYSLSTIRADIHTFLSVTVFPGQTVHKQSVADSTVLERSPDGGVDPYVAYQIGDLQPWGSTSMVGPEGDDYVLPVYIKIVVPNSEPGIDIGEQLYDRCIERFLGTSFEWAGQVRKRTGGSMFPILKADGSIEAQIFPVSFGLLVQLASTS